MLAEVCVLIMLWPKVKDNMYRYSVFLYRSCDTICDKNKKNRLEKGGKRMILRKTDKKELTKHFYLVSLWLKG